MTALTMDSFVAATKREMKTPRGTRTILSVLKQGGTPEGAIAMCAANATKVATAERLEEIVAGVLDDDRMMVLTRRASREREEI